MIDRLEEQKLVKAAGLIGKFFQMDPIAVVSGETFDYAFRVAAYNIVKRMEDEAAEKAKQAQARK